MDGVFEIFRQENGEWNFRLKADNGEILCVSEGHKNLGDILSVYAIYFSNWRVVVDE